MFLRAVLCDIICWLLRLFLSKLTVVVFCGLLTSLMVMHLARVTAFVLLLRTSLLDTIVFRASPQSSVDIVHVQRKLASMMLPS